MPHFTRPNTGDTLAALHVDQFCDFLEVPSGGTEVGLYFLAGGSSASGWTISNWMKTNNRWSGPLSVSLSTSVQSPTGGAVTPSTSNIDPSGFQIYFVTNAASTNARVGGIYTATY